MSEERIVEVKELIRKKSQELMNEVDEVNDAVKISKEISILINELETLSKKPAQPTTWWCCGVEHQLDESCSCGDRGDD